MKTAISKSDRPRIEAIALFFTLPRRERLAGSYFHGFMPLPKGTFILR
ncbi:MAG: hypothetical protein F6K18_23105 [Okeania sp. SIO2C2]|nr:hypothetical protein [Okeania sp. SIO2C2]NEP89486.1 hypothetical protein [Okeania sp. SIO2C2]